MKLSFKSLIFPLIINLYSPISSARSIFIITYNNHKETASAVYEIINRDFEVPKKSITFLQKDNPCEPIKDSIFHMCIDEKREMHLAHINRKVMKLAYGQYLWK